jgi:hypothetical protein
MESDAQFQTYVGEFVGQMLPNDESHQWMRVLAQIGAWVSAAANSKPLTVAICLPRVEFAGLLLASGACLQATQSPMPGDWHRRLGELAGRRIAYSLRGKNPHVYWEGILCELEPSDSAKVRIQGTSDGNVDLWPLTDLFNLWRLTFSRKRHFVTSAAVAFAHYCLKMPLASFAVGGSN